MIDQLNDVLQKNLPAQVAGEMKKALEHYEKVKVDLELCQNELKECKEERLKINSRIAVFESMENDYVKGIEKNRFEAEKLALDRRDLKVKELEYKLEFQKQINCEHKDLMAIAFKHVRPVTVTHQNEYTTHTEEYNNQECKYEKIETGRTVEARTTIEDE